MGSLWLGRELLARLVSDPTVQEAWTCSLQRCGARPLRVEFDLPRGDLAKVADLPFELMADGDGFLFRRFGWTLVRSLHKVSARL